MADGIKQKCDFCKDAAIVDSKTTMGPWAYLCDVHNKKYGTQVEGEFTLLQQAQTKRCSRCNKVKPLSEFYTYKDVNKHIRYRPECKECNLQGRKLSDYYRFKKGKKNNAENSGIK